MLRVHCKSDRSWLRRVLAALEEDGCAVVEGVLDSAARAEFKEALYAVQRMIHDDIGKDRLDRAGELGVLRLMMRYDARFIGLLEIPEVLQVVDNTVSATSIMHLQNGFVLPPAAGDRESGAFQTTFHQDFRRVFNGFVASVNTLITVDDFTGENGATIVVPGTHQQATPPSSEHLLDNAVPIECGGGALIVFDSTLWHAAGINRSAADRCGVNQQFTRSYFKQQLDYVRALGDDLVTAQAPRTQQLLGWYTRLPTSLDEYYVAADQRLYRAGQG